MPMYDYRCPQCGPFRAMRPMAESQVPQGCPACGTPAPRRLLAPFLAGAGSDDGGSGTPRPAGGSGSNWRSLCGFGCSCCR